MSRYVDRSERAEDCAGDHERIAEVSGKGLRARALRRNPDPYRHLVRQPPARGTTDCPGCHKEDRTLAAVSWLVPGGNTRAQVSIVKEEGSGLIGRQCRSEPLPFDGPGWDGEGDRNDDTKARSFHGGRVRDRA